MERPVIHPPCGCCKNCWAHGLQTGHKLAIEGLQEAHGVSHQWRFFSSPLPRRKRTRVPGLPCKSRKRADLFHERGCRGACGRIRVEASAVAFLPLMIEQPTLFEPVPAVERPSFSSIVSAQNLAECPPDKLDTTQWGKQLQAVYDVPTL